MQMPKVTLIPTMTEQLFKALTFSQLQLLVTQRDCLLPNSQLTFQLPEPLVLTVEMLVHLLDTKISTVLC